MKRNILYIGMLLAALIVFSACDEAMESNLPAEYATVLYFQGSGEVDVDMTNVEEGEVTYRLIICKGGNQLGGKRNDQYGKYGYSNDYFYQTKAFIVFLCHFLLLTPFKNCLRVSGL